MYLLKGFTLKSALIKELFQQNLKIFVWTLVGRDAPTTSQDTCQDTVPLDYLDKPIFGL